jgi:hypothetical protein
MRQIDAVAVQAATGLSQIFAAHTLSTSIRKNGGVSDSPKEVATVAESF